MDHWPTGISIPSSHSGEQRSTRGSRPLKVVSGNRQTFALDCHAGPENQNHQDLCNYYINPSSSETKYLSNTFPTTATLGSNDNERAAHRLHHRHQRRHRQHSSSIDPRFRDRSYLTSKEYLDYRSRQRKDLGHDNKQVWSDDVEEAFQEALFEIEPMGRGRRPQRGKLNGRNELIAEYIFRRTGEWRDRKQVSSHIQVLKALLKDIPSWRTLTESVEHPGGANRGYYENSIEHKVEQKRQHLSVQQSSYRNHGSRIHTDDLPPPLQTLGSNTFTASGKRVTGVNFEMWMSPNQNNMDKRLHDFTSLQTARDLPRCDPTPLENVPNWRSSYPCLAATLDSKGDVPKVDIIMIETSYKMMSEFPPPKATLGLRLEIDFGKKSRNDLFDWTCTTHIYQNGAPVKEASHYRLEAKWGMVAPPFESMWWALTFLDKVEQRKQAEETGKSDVFNATQQKAHDFFSQLTAVHEIRARSPVVLGAPESRSERDLVAVLLWKFSIAPETYVGTTSWRRLISPPARITTNSPPNPQTMSMPPFALDTMVDSHHYPSELGDNKDLLNEQPNAHYHDYRADLDDSDALLGQHDFEMTLKEEDVAHFASMQSSFMPSSQGEHESQSFHTLDNFDYDIPIHGLSPPSQHDPYHTASTNLFETQHISHTELAEHHRDQSQGQLYGLHPDFEHDNDGTTHSRPLATFDHSTHNMLQAQLAEPAPADKKQEHPDTTLRAALAAASAMNDLGNPHIALPPHPPSQPESKHDQTPAIWDPMPPHRPPLHTYPSFTSTASYTPHHDHDATSAPTANSTAFDANDIAVGFDDDDDDDDDGAGAGGDYTAATSSPEIRRLLEKHNQSFAGESHPHPATAEDAKGGFGTGIGAGFVGVDVDVDAHAIGQDACDG